MENLKNYIIVSLISFVLGGAVIKYAFPTPANEAKKQTTDTEVIKNDVTTVVSEEIKPDGTKKVTTTTTDKSEKKSVAKTTESKVTLAKPDLFFGLGYVKNIKDKEEKDDFQFVLGKRLAGPVLGFVTYQFKGVITGSVVVEF